MSIAITAPQKFAFQDLVCIEMMLRFFEKSSVEFYVEPDGGEDAELTYTDGEQTVRCDIQVKGAESAITLPNVAACLVHAPPLKAGPTLFERLTSDPNRFVLLVMSGRANDASSIYLGRKFWRGEIHASSLIKAKHAQALIEAISNADVVGKEDSPLKNKRQKHNADLAASLDSKDVRKALSRFVILDQVDDIELQARCEELLQREHGIPSDRTRQVLLELRSAVVQAKNDRTDAFAILKEVLERASPPPIRPANYIARGDEAELVDAISRDNMLLLSGTPRVGKTYAARWIASEFMQHGYDVREFSEVEAAERYLLEPGTSLRFALLDDPLGGAHISTHATNSLSRLTNLILRTTAQRKLLVVQGLEPLLATSRMKSLDQIVTAHRRWRDMERFDPDFLTGLWQSLASTCAVEATLRERVSDALMNGDLQLEPGCIEYLAANTHRLGVSATIADVLRLAREDAAQLGQTLAADGLEELTVSLSVTTAPREPIGLIDLAFVRGDGGTGLPSKRNLNGSVLTIGGPSISKGDAPAYDAPPELAAADRDGLDMLERRRLIEIDGIQNVGFSHPFYRSAAETLLAETTYHGAQVILDGIRRGLFCLSPQTSRATARNLDWIFDRLNPDSSARGKLVQEAIEGLKSFFPATRDLCFRFLLKRLPELPAKLQKELPIWIRSVASITLTDLEWSNGEAHLPYGTQSGTDYFDRAFRSISREEVLKELALLDAPEGIVKPEHASNVLCYFATAGDTMTLTMAGRLISFDEAALRAETIEIWLRQPRQGDDDLLDRIFAEDHPSCALAALKGAIQCWTSSMPDRQERLLNGLVNLAKTLAGAAAMLDRLVLFNRVEYTGELPPWPIFERLMPVVMETLPENAVFNDGRLFSVASSAVDALSASSVVGLCDGWIDWLERNERAGRLPSDSSLGVTDILLSATEAEPALRKDRVKRLLGFAGTGAKVTFTADLIDHWPLLRADERAALVKRLTSGCEDDRWLQAVALTRTEVPEAIASKLLPGDLELSQPPERLVDAMPSDLLEAVVMVYCGEPQPLWWLGTHHSGEEVWEPVVELIARRPDHALFELAWEHVAYNGDGKRLARIISDIGATSAEHVLDILLRLKVRCTGNFMPEAWAALLELASDTDELDRWLGRMAQTSPAILDDVSDLKLWMTEKKDLRNMAEKLSQDFTLILTAERVFAQFDSVDANERREQATKVFTALVRERPPMLFGTCDRLIQQLERAEVDAAELVELLRDRRAAIITEREALKDKIDQPDPPLTGWICP